MAKGKILIVENDNDVLESIKLLLENEGAFKGPAKGQYLNCMDEQEYNVRSKVTVFFPIPQIY